MRIQAYSSDSIAQALHAGEISTMQGCSTRIDAAGEAAAGEHRRRLVALWMRNARALFVAREMRGMLAWGLVPSMFWFGEEDFGHPPGLAAELETGRCKQAGSADSSATSSLAVAAREHRLPWMAAAMGGRATKTKAVKGSVHVMLRLALDMRGRLLRGLGFVVGM